MNQRLIKIIDLYAVRMILNVFLWFKKADSEYTIHDIGKYNRFLIIRPGGIWDAVHLLPLLDYLNRLGKQVDILCMNRNREVFQIFRNAGLVETIYSIENLRDVKALLFKKEYDVIFDTEQYFFSATFLALFLRKKCLVWFDTNERRYFYNFFVNYKQEDYEAQSFMNLLQVFWIRKQYEFDSDSLKTRLRIASLQKDEKILAVFNGWGNSVRSMSMEKILNVLNVIWRKYDSIYIIWGSSEVQSAQYVEKNYVWDNLKNFTWKLSLTGTFETLARSTHLLTTDSGPLHLWVIAGVQKIVWIFWPWIIEKWGWKTVRVIREDLSCIGCNYGRWSQTPMCPYAYKCMKDIDEQKILFALNHL